MTDIVNPIDPPVVPPVPQRSDEATFEDRSDAGWEFAFETLPGYMQDTMDNVHQNAVATNERALAADQRATDAEAAKGLAEDARDAAQQSAEESEASRQSALAAAAAAGSAAGLPSLAGKAGGVLMVNPDELGVVWGSIPDVSPPSNVLPTNGATDVKFGIFAGSPYYSLYGKPQKARQMRISLSEDFSVVTWDSGAVAGAEQTVSPIDLTGKAPASTTVYWQIRYQDEADAWSAWSAPTSFTTAAALGPLSPGEPYGGGFYAGNIKIWDDTYAVITAPKSAEVTIQWKISNDSTPGTTSTADGLANSNAMNNAQHPAAKHCREYRGGGHSDWYLPAKSELELHYRAFKPDATANNTASGANPDSVPTAGAYAAGAPAQTSLSAFRTGGAEAFTAYYYWSSTDYPASGGAWCQNFSDGSQSGGNRGSSYVARPVRRFKL